MAEVRRLGIEPIVDLLHFGIPDWLGEFSNPEFPLRFAEYADAVVQRYPWVRFYTPINEIYVCAAPKPVVTSASGMIWEAALRLT